MNEIVDTQVDGLIASIYSENFYEKQFTDPHLFDLETQGHYFFSRYYSQVPGVIAVEKDRLRIFYERLNSQQGRVLTDCMVDDERVNLRTMFGSLATIANKHATVRRPEGGTQLFFFSRINRLREAALVDTYSDLLAGYGDISINGTAVRLDPMLLERLHTYMAGVDRGLCVPSQGDLHERNIFAHGHIIDFEGAGWNLLSTDIATFMHHILVGGNHLGPRYAKWSTETDMYNYRKNRQEVTFDRGRVVINLNEARKDILRQFVADYIKKIASADAQILHDTSLFLAIRLLTVFNPVVMTEADRIVVFALANYFASSKHTLLDQLELFLKVES